MMVTQPTKKVLGLVALFVGGLVTYAYLFGNFFGAGSLEKVILKFESEFADVPQMRSGKLMEISATHRDNLILIDVREANERKVSLIPGAMTLPEFRSNRGLHDGKIVVVYCTVGYRSAKAARALQKDNISAFNLRGGIVGWTQVGGDLVDESGVATRKVHTYGRAWDFVPEDYVAVW